MDQSRITFIASALVVGSGVLWGFYWLPVRALTQAGLPGACGTLAITAGASILLLPFALRHRQNLRTASPVAIAAVALGGCAFALYSIGFVYGRVAIIILLFFLTPVWSTLIGRYVFGWHTPPMRVAAIIVGLIGLAIMLSANGVWPIPRNTGEWMALVSGILWSIGSTGMRTKSTLEPVAAAFLFALGAAITSLMIALVLAPFPNLASYSAISAIALGTGGLWWGITIVGLMWATVRLEPARVGILLMSEVLIGAASAAIIAGEHLSTLEIIGGALVLCAGILEIWPIKEPRPAPRRS